MKNNNYARLMFRSAAAWNWAASLAFFFAYRPIFDLLNMAAPVYPVMLRLFLALAFVFGVGYWWVSGDTGKNRDIVRLGVMGKLLVALIMTAHYLMGEIHLLVAMAGMVDLVYAILFIHFLYTHKAGEQ